MRPAAGQKKFFGPIFCSDLLPKGQKEDKTSWQPGRKLSDSSVYPVLQGPASRFFSPVSG